MERDFLGRGLSFPVRPSPSRLIWADGDEKIRQSIWLILSTSPGERQMRSEFGCGIHDLVFEANTSALRASVKVAVRRALIQWEPRVDLLDVRVETLPEARNQLQIHIDYQVRETHAVHNLVYPFYLTEGVG
ncbi:MAG: GPW/gp25 family protein [Acidobacteriota bacterium]